MPGFRAAAACRSAGNFFRVAAAPPAAGSCRHSQRSIIGFALTLLLMGPLTPMAVVPGLSVSIASANFAARVNTGGQLSDTDHNGIEDVLDQWRLRSSSWSDLRELAAGPPKASLVKEKSLPPAPGLEPRSGIWQAGGLRILHFGPLGPVARVLGAKSAAGHLTLLHDLDLAAGVQVLAVDQAGLALLLDSSPGGRVMLDRCGTPALDVSRPLVGIPVMERVPWRLGRDWSGSVAILDSGCDTAHGDLGDPVDDDIDGPPPAVGDLGDWYPADQAWSLNQNFKVVGWHDVTNDFPLAAGPWDYHWHGTALASVVAGSGRVDSRFHGVAMGARLTIVKFYDFDGQWRTWAGDFLAACAWTLDHAAVDRVRAVLCAVNWEADLGIGDAMTAFAAAGIVPVAAMGNQGPEGGDPGFPAGLPQVITVGAVNDQGAVAAYSGRGAADLFKPDLVAPGGGLLTDGGRIMAADNEPNDSYRGRYGTSLAAAHVAGSVYLLGEALRAAGWSLPGTLTSVQTLTAVLKTTAAPVTKAETSDGSGTESLPAQTGYDAVRGWGLLRIDAAVKALREPLAPGQTARDTLIQAGGVPVMARRLITTGTVGYRIEAAPAAGLDVSLEVVDIRQLAGNPRGTAVVRSDDHGPGVPESVEVDAATARWLLAAVKIRSGQGRVDLSLQEADPATAVSHRFMLPGVATAGPNVAQVAGVAAPSLVIPSLVTVDAKARVLNVTDLQGSPRPGWPVFLFPDPSSQGGLNLPLAWDLDQIPGDEIVATSAYGSVYFFAGDGSYQRVGLTLNQLLTNPVVVLPESGMPRVAVVDQIGVVRAWTTGAVLVAQRALGHGHPLAPACGRLVPGGAEALVVAFRDGFVTALDADLDVLPGWPLDLGHDLALPPVLADRDTDGLQEIVVPVWFASGDDLTLRILRGDGSSAPGDGTLLDAPSGGDWLSLSAPAIGGGYAFGGLKVDLVGLMDNGLGGQEAVWNLGCARLGSGGPTGDPVWPGFRVQASVDETRLTLDQALLPPPLEYDREGPGGNEPEALVHLHWQDLLYGLTTMPASATGWFGPGSGEDPLAWREPLDAGGEDAPARVIMGAALVQDHGIWHRVQVADNQVAAQPLGDWAPAAPSWLTARADGRNSGAAALLGSPSAAPAVAEPGGDLEAFPNPGSGRIFFRCKGAAAAPGAVLEVYDLRGRRLVSRALPTDPGAWVWDGRGVQGSPLPAGVYLATVRLGARRLTTRLTLTP